jgi:hypothetical protein
MKSYTEIMDHIEELKDELKDISGDEARGELEVELSDYTDQLEALTKLGGYESAEEMIVDYEEGDKSLARRPRHIHSYENDDADGNRGEWVDFYFCPECGAELDEQDFEHSRCQGCMQKLELDGDSEWD